MDVGMLFIVAVIVIPGYFIISYLTRVLYSQSSMLDENVEENNRKQSSESEINEATKESKENDKQKTPQLHKRVTKKIIKQNKKSESPVMTKYRKQAKNKQ
jgi:predicted Holliday junction resolvase-like endonuclease